MSPQSPEQAKAQILQGEQAPLQVAGLLDLRGALIHSLPSDLSCYDLDVSATLLEALPAKLKVRSRLRADDCPLLESLPVGLRAGSMSFRHCPMLTSLPEKLSTWFLDLSHCHQFQNWPLDGAIQCGHLILRDCRALRELPDWLGSLAQVDLAGCANLTHLPDSLQVTGWLDVGGSGLGGLPPQLAGVPLRWRGIPVDRRLAFHPEDLTVQEVVNEADPERREVMIERFGYLRFAQAAAAAVVDQDEDPGGARKLLKVEFQQGEPLVGLSCIYRSTSRQYFLRVPAHITRCHDAAAWLAGYDDPAQYKPNQAKE